MLSFQRFIVERLALGLKGSFGYNEVYTKATAADIEKVGNFEAPPTDNLIPGGLQTARCYFVGGFVTSDNFIVFDRKNGGTHADVSEDPNVIKKLGVIKKSTTIPIYAYWFSQQQTLVLSIATWSAGAKQTNAQLRRVVKDHPAFKRYKKVVVYDNPESIAY